MSSKARQKNREFFGQRQSKNGQFWGLKTLDLTTPPTSRSAPVQSASSV